ncbi:hypothetical protein [Streptomyces sp. NPDC059744]|uniref:hypothetical protein n=1 Tax=Streptomyces sp. NPDC059744 TaxID=3346929 RepID=UPI003653F74F
MMTTATDPPGVRTGENDGIFVITIDRPKARNVSDGATARAPAAAVDRLESRNEPCCRARPARSDPDTTTGPGSKDRVGFVTGGIRGLSRGDGPILAPGCCPPRGRPGPR